MKKRRSNMKKRCSNMKKRRTKRENTTNLGLKSLNSAMSVSWNSRKSIKREIVRNQWTKSWRHKKLYIGWLLITMLNIIWRYIWKMSSNMKKCALIWKKGAQIWRKGRKYEKMDGNLKKKRVQKRENTRTVKSLNSMRFISWNSEKSIKREIVRNQW